MLCLQSALPTYGAIVHRCQVQQVFSHHYWYHKKHIGWKTCTCSPHIARHTEDYLYVFILTVLFRLHAQVSAMNGGLGMAAAGGELEGDLCFPRKYCLSKNTKKNMPTKAPPNGHCPIASMPSSALRWIEVSVPKNPPCADHSGTVC